MSESHFCYDIKLMKQVTETKPFKVVLRKDMFL